MDILHGIYLNLETMKEYRLGVCRNIKKKMTSCNVISFSSFKLNVAFFVMVLSGLFLNT